MTSELTPPGAEFRPHRHLNRWLLIGIPLFSLLSIYLAVFATSQAARNIPTLKPLYDTVFGGGSPLGFAKALPGADADKDSDEVTIEDRINILFLGLDRRIDELENTPSRTDSVVIFSLDPFTNTGGGFSIPRDTLVTIPDGRGGTVQDRINTAYEYGDIWNYPGGGPQLAIDTIERNFNIPIDHYIVLDFTNFKKIIDELGGIDINVPEYAYDPAYTDCQFCGRYWEVEFEPGREHMDGERALEYARIRHSDNDYKRIERQQLVFRAAARKASDIGVLLGSNPISLYNQYKNAVRSDISDPVAGLLALLGRKIGPDNIRMVSMAPATYPCTFCTGALLQWDPAQVEELKAQVFSDGRLQQEQAVVKVLNGTATPDLADHFASYLRDKGVGSERLTIDEYAGGALYPNTLIVDLSGKEYTAQKLAEWLKVPRSRIISGDDARAESFRTPDANVVVVLGSDASVPSASAVESASGTQYGG